MFYLFRKNEGFASSAILSKLEEYKNEIQKEEPQNVFIIKEFENFPLDRLSLNQTGEVIISEIPKPTLEELKDEKLNNLKSISDSFRSQLINKEMYITSSLGFIVDADKDSQDNVQGLIDILPNDELTIQYRDRNNEMHNLNRSQLETILKEMKLNGVELFNQKWRLESQIENARSESELNQIDLAFQMMDFTSNI